jgi:ankyrin repeat protein
MDKILSLLKECPALGHWRDAVTGYSAVHWAARKGNVDLLKALANVEGFDPNARTSGGYTALHLAAQFKRDEFFEMLAGSLGGDTSVRDYSGKKPYQYK